MWDAVRPAINVKEAAKSVKVTPAKNVVIGGHIVVIGRGALLIPTLT
jgi:hypothetical protein